MRKIFPYRHCLPVPDVIHRLPVYVTGAGWEMVAPGDPYPQPDASIYAFCWEEGRELPEFCLAWLSEGAGHLETRQRRQAIPRRRAFFFHPGEWHRHRPAPGAGWTIHWVTFNGSLPHQWMRDGDFHLEGNLPVIDDRRLFQLQLMRLVRSVHARPADNTPALSWQLVGLVSHFVGRGHNRSAEINHHDDEMVNQAVQFIWSHSHNFIDVPNVVAHVGCSRRSLERRFSKELGHSVLDEIQQCRFERAQRLLGETHLPIKQVVYRAGLRSRQQLWLLFHEKTGMSPDEFRHHG